MFFQARRKDFCIGGAICAEGATITAGVSGALKAPQRVQGRALVGVRGEPPEALQFYSFKGHRLA